MNRRVCATFVRTPCAIRTIVHFHSTILKYLDGIFRALRLVG